jgi:hypothetical protein
MRSSSALRPKATEAVGPPAARVTLGVDTHTGVALVAALLNEMRARQIVAPALSTVERLGWETPPGRGRWRPG